jgi:hypothetical protein
LSCLVLSCLVLSCLALPCPVLSCLTLLHLVFFLRGVDFRQRQDKERQRQDKTSTSLFAACLGRSVLFTVFCQRFLLPASLFASMYTTYRLIHRQTVQDRETDKIETYPLDVGVLCLVFSLEYSIFCISLFILLSVLCLDFSFCLSAYLPVSISSVFPSVCSNTGPFSRISLSNCLFLSIFCLSSRRHVWRTSGERALPHNKSKSIVEYVVIRSTPFHTWSDFHFSFGRNTM